MAVAVALTFPAGRFHATPWGHHVNEGLPEWPPSPWRLLRAFVATWRRKLHDDPSVNDLLPGVLNQLATPPFFHLPEASLGHTRHYMPLKFPDQGDRTKVFDAFVALDPKAEVVFLWPDVILNNAEERCLSLVLSSIGYLGRAESWCSGQLLQEPSSRYSLANSMHHQQSLWTNCAPLNDSRSPERTEPVRVLVPDPQTWNQWSFGAKIGRPDPPWNLLAETADLHAERWSDPPGSRWITYLRRSDCFQVRPARKPNRPMSRRFTVARYALDGVVLPLVQQTLPLAEQFRRALMGKYRQILEREQFGNDSAPANARSVSPIFSGKGPDGRPLVGHEHAYYLPTDEDNDGHIDHVTIVAMKGFDPHEVQALDRLRHLHFGEGEPLNLLLIGLGVERDVSGPLFGPSETWVSATPFLATRHPKRRGTRRDRPELLGPENRDAFVLAVLREEIDRWRERCPEVAEPTSIEPLPEHRMGIRQLRPIQFQRFRRKAGDDGGRRASGAFRIVFPSPLSGPMCLGYSSHFGLGLFLPDYPN